MSFFLKNIRNSEGFCSQISSCKIYPVRWNPLFLLVELLPLVHCKTAVHWPLLWWTPEKYDSESKALWEETKHNHCLRNYVWFADIPAHQTWGDTYTCKTARDFSLLNDQHTVILLLYRKMCSTEMSSKLFYL